ncbi:hypothetical protein [Xenorhabdus mauleonii]|uniref:hypothetical protein n=1 Tax=Xenorhabdus mauleonii TaxID=351675 RepID=UPI001FCE4039|nr:hypothetical protein [Xenorhabdus mauleonii]
MGGREPASGNLRRSQARYQCWLKFSDPIGKPPQRATGTYQPTIGVFRGITLALNVSADMLLFEPDERGPDERLKLQFEAISPLDEKEWETVISSILHMHDAKRLTTKGS